MRYSDQIRPISYLKKNATEVVAQLAEQRRPMVITQHGEAKAVIQDVLSYEEMQDTLALLKMLALGIQQVAGGKTRPAREVLKRMLGNSLGLRPVDWLVGFDLLITQDAERDLDRIYQGVFKSDGRQRANTEIGAIFESLTLQCLSLELGEVPPELRALGLTEYREHFFEPYRMLYRQAEHRMILHLITNTPCDMEYLLARRLLRA
jgi:prevent-host-death family protein